MTDSTIRTAVDAWLSNSAAAEATYGHISTWKTSGVTDMWELFEDASSFNEDIGAWDTSGVKNVAYMFRASAFNQDIGGWAVHSITTMFAMFWQAAAFNQDLGGWTLDSVTDMRYMFYYVSAFDQDLGWCVDDGVSLSSAFSSSGCESTSCGVKQCLMSDSTIRTAVSSWLYSRSYAEATYGHISTWETGGVTDMSDLFQEASAFNELRRRRRPQAPSAPTPHPRINSSLSAPSSAQRHSSCSEREHIRTLPHGLEFILPRRPPHPLLAIKRPRCIKEGGISTSSRKKHTTPSATSAGTSATRRAGAPRAPRRRGPRGPRASRSRAARRRRAASGRPRIWI